MLSTRHRTAILAAIVFLPVMESPAQDTWRADVESHRQRRDALLRSDPFSPLALVHREYLDGRTKLTIGSGAGADLRLAGEGVPLHATLEVSGEGARVRAEGSARLGRVAYPSEGGETRISTTHLTEVDLSIERGFRIGRYNLLFRRDAPVRGAAIEVYDTAEPALGEFRGLEFFPPDARFRVQAEIVPRAEPPQIQLVDSAGQPRPFYVYGDLRFELNGKPVTMELYTTTLDREAIARSGFMLIFADLTSGRESYSAGRYLDIEGKPSGTVTVDFNLARNPPCNFSPVYTCPFPRAQNRLPVAIRAGEKAYTGVTATARQPAPQ